MPGKGRDLVFQYEQLIDEATTEGLIDAAGRIERALRDVHDGEHGKWLADSVGKLRLALVAGSAPDQSLPAKEVERNAVDQANRKPVISNSQTSDLLRVVQVASNFAWRARSKTLKSAFRSRNLGFVREST
jgi:hypothetical protein